MKRKEERRPASGAATRKANFPGGAVSGPGPALRVAFDRAPMADLIAHAALTPEVEVGGVLVGYLGEDSSGRFVHVQAVIRAEQAREQGAHVTFTHDTWNHIHGEMDSRHRGLEIVGWYHTHPGFGVFLSEMDTFIHENFFNQPHHVALVYDPLSGRMCMSVLRETGLVRLERYWRDGREVVLQPETTGKAEWGGAQIAGLLEAVNRLESRIAAPQPRGWVDEWLVPVLLMAILVLGIHGFFVDREGEVTRLKADLFDRIQLLADTGQIQILDGAGRGFRLNGLTGRPNDPTSHETPRRQAPSTPARPGGGSGASQAPGSKP